MLSAKSPQSLFNCFYKFNASLKAPLLCKVLLCTLGLDQSPPRAQHKFGCIWDTESVLAIFSGIPALLFLLLWQQKPSSTLSPWLQPSYSSWRCSMPARGICQAATWTAPGRPAVGQSRTSQTPLTSASFPGGCPRSAQVPVLSDRS